MERTKQGFEVLVRSHAGELYSFAYGMCRDNHLAEDLVQETFLRAWKHLHTQRDHHGLRAWLYTILRNEHARQYRKRSNETIDLDELKVVAPKVFDASTEAFVLRRALQSLPDAYREPLLLQVLGGFSCTEIAGMLDLTPDNVMARVSRARRKLRDLLRTEGEENSIREIS